MTIDLHHLSWNEAHREFIAKYNEGFKKNIPKIKVIHGYGSKGKGGVIKKKLLNFFKENRDNLEYYQDLNLGRTFVIPKKKLLDPLSELENKVIVFCSKTPKTMKKIEGNFFKNYSSNEIKRAVNSLTKKGILKSFSKGSHLVYIKEESNC